MASMCAFRLHQMLGRSTTTTRTFTLSISWPYVMVTSDSRSLMSDSPDAGATLVFLRLLILVMHLLTVCSMVFFTGFLYENNLINNYVILKAATYFQVASHCLEK